MRGAEAVGYSPYKHPADPDADNMPPNAESCLDYMDDVERHLLDIETYRGAILAELERKRDAVLDDAEAFTLGHVHTWRDLHIAFGQHVEALMKLVERVRAA